MSELPKFVEDEGEVGPQGPTFSDMALLVGEWYATKQFDDPSKYNIFIDHYDAIAWCYVYLRGDFGGAEIPPPYLLGIRNAYQFIVDSYGKPVYNGYTLEELLD